jgi:hypothetical protein
VEAYEGAISALDDEVDALLTHVSVVLWEEAQTNGCYARADDKFCVDHAVSQPPPPIEDVRRNEVEVVAALCDAIYVIVPEWLRVVLPHLLEILIGSAGAHLALRWAVLHILPLEQRRHCCHLCSRLRSTTASAGSRSSEHGHPRAKTNTSNRTLRTIVKLCSSHNINKNQCEQQNIADNGKPLQ